MALLEFSMIRLRTDRYKDAGAGAGALGVILDAYGDDAYEVEFSHPDGTTYAWFAVEQDEVEPAPEPAVAGPSVARTDRS